jgi:hypothetical protein
MVAGILHFCVLGKRPFPLLSAYSETHNYFSTIDQPKLLVVNCPWSEKDKSKTFGGTYMMQKGKSAQVRKLNTRCVSTPAFQ